MAYERRKSLKKLLLYFLIASVVLYFTRKSCMFSPWSSECQGITNFPKILHILKNDTHADHCVMYNFLSRSNTTFTKYELITLDLHSTINYAEHLIKQAEEWDDFISYAAFLFPGHDAGLGALAKLHKCHKLINQKVSIHLVWHRHFVNETCTNDFILETINGILKTTETCDNFNIKSVKSTLKEIKTPLATYPINVMRNEARRGGTTKLHLIGDMETRFSPNFAANVRPLTQRLLNGDLGKAVLVYRRFEMDENEIFPRSLKSFQLLFNAKKIVQFHVEYFKVGHYIPNLDQWLQYSLENEEISFEQVSYTRSEWEPQFIMTSDTPYHYEHAPTRWLDHQFLCYELCRAGYSYLVMSHVYNIHRGIKKQLTAVEMASGMYALTQKDIVMPQYASYINVHYPINERAKCPNWEHYL